MTIEHKSTKSAVMGIDGRTVTGVFAVHGVVDDGDGWSSRDRSHPGLFGDFKVDGRSRVVFLWQHDSREPPIATIDDLAELSRAELPEVITRYAPEATGGVLVKRTYLETPRADQVLAGIRSGALSEMSYAYEARRWDFEEPAEGSYMPIRNLYSAYLYDVSDVNWGMNPATSADGTKVRSIVDSCAELQGKARGFMTRLRAIVAERLKAGRTFSQANYDAISTLADEIEQAAKDLRGLLAQAEPKQATDMRRVLLETQRAIARINGVRL